jgi:hypothetical protein
MSPGDDDIAAALPRPPLPAPARREAAIAAALRRFDGDEAPIRERRPAPALSWRRPYVGALAGAALVALIALPLAWTSLDEQPYRDLRKPSPAHEAPPRPAADPAPSPSPAAPPVASAEAAPATAPQEAGVPAPVAVAQPAPEPAPVAAPPPPAEPLARGPEERSNAPGKAGGDQIVVTGTRIPRPNLESATPVTVLDSGIVATAGRAAAARPARRGDWNVCTVEDPGRSLAGCRVSAETGDGLERAWKGDWEGASRAFDAAVAAAPRSSSAYLNRGLVRRRSGELERALADLDRAVRFSPRVARYYYHRSQVLRQLGDAVRAQADEARAVELDPRYASVVEN